MNDLKISKTLAVTKADFLRLLPSAMCGLSYKIKQNDIVAIQKKSRIEINLQEKKSRKIGAISLPQLQIDFCFVDWQKVDVDRFIERFNRNFQRGGG